MLVCSAVPIFFMISGASLLGYRERYTTKAFFKKRLSRVGIPFVFWNLFYIAYSVVMNEEPIAHSVSDFVSKLINSEFQVRYWFFYPLFALYLCIPVLSLFLKVPGHRKYLWYAVTLAFGFDFVMVPILRVFEIPANSYITFPLAGGFVIYAIFGWLVSNSEWKRKSRLILYAATLAVSILTIFYIFFLSAKTGKTVQWPVAYRAFPAALVGASIFVFFKHLKIKESPVFAKTVGIIASGSLGVWLTHSIGITLLVHFTKINMNSYLFRFGGSAVIYLVCLAGVLIVKKIPFIRRLV